MGGVTNGRLSFDKRHKKEHLTKKEKSGRLHRHQDKTKKASSGKIVELKQHFSEDAFL